MPSIIPLNNNGTLPKDDSSTPCTDSASANTPSCAEAATKTTPAANLQRNPGEIAFFKLLHAEFHKATRFFEKAVVEFAIREERVREGMEIVQQRPNSILTERWGTLARSIFRLYKDLLLLETYAIMTYCSFSKILKKHDKVTGTTTRAAFMTNVVHKANFNNYPSVLAMISRCEEMHATVCERLSQDGKEGLYEDERLFINMIARLNAQALGYPDAPEGRSSRAVPSVPSISASSKPGPPEMERLRELVEEHEACCVSETESAKRPRPAGEGVHEAKKRSIG